MKLNASLLQAIVLGVTLSAVGVSATSCEKIERETAKNGREANSPDTDGKPSDPCGLCGMG